MTDERLEEIRASMAESPVGAYATELLAEVDRLRALEPRLRRVEALLGALVKRLERVKEECRDV